MSSAIPALSPKRTNSAIEASTIRSARETTQVRRRKRASQCRWREWARAIPCAGMFAFDPVLLLLPDVEAALRDRLAVGRPVVRAVQAHAPALQALEKSFESGPVTTPQFPVDDPSGSTIPSLPDPEFVDLFLESATFHRVRPRPPGLPARAFARKL